VLVAVVSKLLRMAQQWRHEAAAGSNAAHPVTHALIDAVLVSTDAGPERDSATTVPPPRVPGAGEYSDRATFSPLGLRQ